MNETISLGPLATPHSRAVAAGRARVRAWKLALLALALTAAPLAIFSGHQFWLNILIYTYLFAGLAVSWNIIAGFGGQFSLGHGVFFAAGAYTASILYVRYGLSPWLGILPGMVVCGVIGPLIFWPTFRLRGSFFAIATLAFNEVGMAFANYFAITGGPRGVQVPFKAGLANMIFANPLHYALLMFGYMALCLLVASMVRHGRLGYYLLAVRDDQDCARASGIDVARVKLLGMAISAAMTAAGGTLFAMYVRTIDPPTLFSLADVGFKFALLSLIGGIGTVMGPVLGAFLIIPLENWLRTLLSGAIPGAHLLVLGVVMLLAALFMRKGLGHAFAELWRRHQRRRGARGKDQRGSGK